MRVFILYNDERHLIEVNLGQTVGEIKQSLRRKFDLDTVQNEDKDNDLVMALRFAGGSLDDEWIYSDLNIPSGVTIRCELVENVKSYLDIFCVYNGEMIKFTESFSVWETKVGELRSMITDKTGLHVSVFRLVTLEGTEMFDCHQLKDYNISYGDTLRLETWDGWANFLKAATKGHLTPTIKHMTTVNDDPLTAKYQLRVALFIAAHFGYHQLVALLMKSGARSDEPVGEHPIREWCNREVHADHLKTPIHEAAQNGHLTCLRQFIHHNHACILVKDGNGLTPCNTARRHKEMECFKLLIAEQFRSRSIEGLTITLYAKIKKWSERARDRALIFHKHNPSPLLLAMEKRNYRSAAVGQKVYVDGYGKSMQTSASKIQLSLVHSDTKGKSVGELLAGVPEMNTKTSKAINAVAFNSKTDILTIEDIKPLEENRKKNDAEEVQGSFEEGTLHDHTKPSKHLANRVSIETFPVVSVQSRCHSKTANSRETRQMITPTTKRDYKQKQHGKYRWEEGKVESSEGKVEPKINIQATRRESITRKQLNTAHMTSNGSLLRSELNDKYTGHGESTGEIVNEKDIIEDKYRVFVTQRTLDHSTARVNAWVTEAPSDPKQRTRMPPIKTSCSFQSSEHSSQNHNKKLAQKYFSKSYDETIAKSRSAVDVFPKRNGVFRKRTLSEDPALESTAVYRHVTGLDIRESARASLEVATTFNKMSWLQQVQLAIDLNKNTFKRHVFNLKPSKKLAEN